jgi:hypothetical protein
MARRPSRSVPPQLTFARLRVDRLQSPLAKSLCLRYTTPIPAGVRLVPSATPSWHRIPQGLAILSVAAKRKSRSLAELQGLGKSYSAELQHSVTGQDRDEVRRVSQQTHAKSQPSKASLTAELPSRDFAVVPLAKSHPFAFGAIGKSLVRKTAP